MGTFFFAGVPYKFEDRVLAHLQAAITPKLQRREPVLVTWGEGIPCASGHTAIWLTASSSLIFEFENGSAPELNPTWKAVLDWSAGTPEGMWLTSEEDAMQFARTPRGQRVLRLLKQVQARDG